MCKDGDRLWQERLYAGNTQTFEQQCNRGSVFLGVPGNEEFSKVVDPKETLSNEVKDLLNRMLDVNPDQRATMERVHNHSWMQQKCISSDEAYKLVKPRLV